MTRSNLPLVVAVPKMEIYQEKSGIGRVFHSLAAGWRGQVNLVSSDYMSWKFPILRNIPYGIRMPAETNAVLLPQITGASALRHSRTVPSLAIVHDIGIVDFPGDTVGLDWLTKWSIQRSFFGLRHATRIVTDSQFTRERLIARLPAIASRVSAIPCGVGRVFLDYNDSQSKARQRLESHINRALGTPTLLYVGSEIPRKNMALLFKVFRQIKVRYPDALLLKVGGAGGERWRANTLSLIQSLDLSVGIDVLLLEGIDDALLADAYRAADVFVSTSLYEGFGLPALEALAVGTPVVTTDNGASPEVVRKVGMVVAPEVAAFTAAIETIIANGERSADELRRRLHATQFTWAQASSAYLAVMDNLVNR